MTAISPTRQEDFPNWYQEVVLPLAGHGAVRGTQVIKPWGYGAWELLQNGLNDEIKRKGAQNFYAPLFVGMDALQSEAKHIDGFAKECAVVTHSRLKEENGQLVPDGELTEPVIVRPTSEAIIGPLAKDWIHSYRDLPMKLNQWANVVRWEMRTRLFLRSTEFLWQEGHTFHCSATEANAFSLEMQACYQVFLKDQLALPSIAGEKSELERFSGADHTYTLELLMQDGKALQGCTSHDLGQNFSKAYDISYSDENNQLVHAHGTSWGLTTRMIGAIVMVHGDDDGLVLPPKVSPTQIVILPINPKNDPKVTEAVQEFKAALDGLSFDQKPLRVMIDERDYLRGGAKAWEWVKKGVPIRIEIGPKDLDKSQFCLSRRDQAYGQKQFLPLDQVMQIPELLEDIHHTMYQRAQDFMNDNTFVVDNKEALMDHFSSGNSGFVTVFYAGSAEDEQLLGDHQASIRCLTQSETEGLCVFSGNATNTIAWIAKAY
ncbi:proline--tRNA ligase [Candidatus Synchoanobacter obligatus]|uniref:Proline--tRNA ligase n=1 Tax=Candidatus Synchoanobacter obligatus TaxID=2919597 RepID=A0ABT1L4I5_9GAMM|nr:proline--tRNA ligase [Candidatus Synchoanobacter obligatus]MCP8352009.1 proline--tRNA ligase [Candidatus Synchoanobacter obligatus]